MSRRLLLRVLGAYMVFGSIWGGGAAHAETRQHALLLIPGAAPGALASRLAYRPMEILAAHLREAGAPRVVVAHTANDLRRPRAEALADVQASLRHLLATGATSISIIAHSMGHATALWAILDSDLARHVDLVVGLAGAGHGGAAPPRGCGATRRQRPSDRCPGIKGLLMNEPDYELGRFYARHSEALGNLKTCSLAVQGDRLLNPANSGFFAGGRNFYVDFAGHAELPATAGLPRLLVEACGLNLGAAR